MKIKIKLRKENFGEVRERGEKLYNELDMTKKYLYSFYINGEKYYIWFDFLGQINKESFELLESLFPNKGYELVYENDPPRDIRKLLEELK